MLILAIYYTIADIVLLLQCFYYRGFTWKDEVTPPPKPHTIGEANERTGLLSNGSERRPSTWSEVSHHLSPAVPLLDAPNSSKPPPKPTTTLQATLQNLIIVFMVCAAGVLGWWVSNRSGYGRHQSKRPKAVEEIEFSLWGQIFGYFCAVLYLGSRIPQILLNYRRKSTSGVSMLFFLFACVGNLTYVLSIFVYEPKCSGKHGRCAEGKAARDYGRYILVNASWLAGSMGTLFLDLGIFAQFFIYREVDADDDEGDAANGNTTPQDQRPLLQRGDSTYQA
jgi:hypothetical protein